jgi:hypothetical protein
LNLVSRIAGTARLLAMGKLNPSTGFDGAQMERRLVAWRTGGESVNSLILQGGEQRGRGPDSLWAPTLAANAAASFQLPCGRRWQEAVVSSRGEFDAPVRFDTDPWR